MIKKPVYTFDTTASTGIDRVPLNALMLIEDSDGTGTPKLIYLNNKDTIDNNTTIDTSAVLRANTIPIRIAIITFTIPVVELVIKLL